MLKEQLHVWTDFDAAYEIQETTGTDGAKLFKFTFTYPTEAAKKDRVIGIDFSFPIVDISGVWTPDCGTRRALLPDWAGPRTSMTAIFAPVMCFYNGNAQNKQTLSWSEVDQKVEMQYGVHEEDGTMLCCTRIHLTRDTAVQGYEVILRDVDDEKPYWEVLRDTVNWWEEVKGISYLEAPKAAREPLYSFWYSFHQEVNEKNVEAECELAAKMGFTTIIVDDGWQTADNNRGYAFCGDWEMEPTKFPDFAAHVKRVQAMGLKYMLWFSVPFVGVYSKAYEIFKDKMLWIDGKWGVVDIRYPEAREYLLKIYERAVLEWNLDGLKLDFIDCFNLRKDSPAWQEGMDYADVQEALNALLTEVNTRLRAKKPELLIEFRQAYVGPRVQSYGNMLRVADCPNTAILNRVGIADLRLLSKTSAIHSDMLMWHPSEKPEDAALQVLSCIFGVLQFSVKLDTLSADMKKMVDFWMNFMQEHMDLLQNSMIRPLEPENLYPEISVCKNGEAVLAHYSKGRTVELSDEYQTLYYVHAVKEENVIVRNNKEAIYEYETVDCMGNAAESGRIDGSRLNELCVPAGGMVIFKRV